MAYQFEFFLQTVLIFILQSIAVVLFTLFLWQFWKRSSSKVLPSGPAAFGRGFCVIFPALPMVLYIVWYSNKLLSVFGLKVTATNLYLLIIILAPLVAGYFSTRTYEQAGFFSSALVSGAAMIPYGLVVLALGYDLEAMYKWLPMLLFIPSIFLGALFAGAKPNKALK